MNVVLVLERLKVHKKNMNVVLVLERLKIYEKKYECCKEKYIKIQKYNVVYWSPSWSALLSSLLVGSYVGSSLLGSSEGT